MTNEKEQKQGELKPCPFCGDTATLIQSKSKAGGYTVKCDYFECQTMRHGGTRTAAIKKWNIRANSQSELEGAYGAACVDRDFYKDKVTELEKLNQELVVACKIALQYTTYVDIREILEAAIQRHANLKQEG